MRKKRGVRDQGSGVGEKHVSLFSRLFLQPSAFILQPFLLLLLLGCGPEPEHPTRIRIGYFPNVTHAQALIGVNRGDFDEAFAPDLSVETSTYNAGPAIIEAIYAGHLDIAYIGPSPIINGFLKSDEEEVRVIAGAAENGILVVGNKKRGITSLEQLRGARVATPQRANTQDISARHYIVNVLNSPIGDDEGETEVIPMTNPDIEILFIKDQIDAAWVPEPWGSRMAESGLVNIIAEEKDLWESGRFTLTNVIARKAFLEKHPGLVERFLAVHVQITRELNANPESFIPVLNDQMQVLTGKTLPEEVMAGCLAHCSFTVEVDAPSLERFFQKGRDLGYLRYDRMNIERLVNTDPLERVLAARAQATESTP